MMNFLKHFPKRRSWASIRLAVSLFGVVMA